MDSHVSTIPHSLYSIFRRKNDRKIRACIKQASRCYYRDHRRLTKPAAGLPALLNEGFDHEQIYGMMALVKEAESDIAPEDDIAESMKECESAELMQESGSSQQESEDDGDYADDNDDEEQDEDSPAALSSDEEHDKEIHRIASKILGDSNDSEDLEDMEIGDEDEEEMSEEMEDDDEEDEAANETVTKATNKKQKKSEVDDEFFQMEEMEKFLDQEDRKASARNRKEEDNDEEEEEDLLEEDSEEDNGQPIMYQDFFDPPAAAEGKTDKKEGRRKAERGESQEEGQDDSNDDGDEDDMDEEDTPAKSQLFDDDDDDDDVEEEGDEETFHERRNKKVKASLERQELALVQEQSWQMAGEALARSRPESSLLEINLNHTSAVPADPEMTDRTTEDLESWIKQRIKDKAWDDVERKVKPPEDSFQYRKKMVLESQKSEKSLMAEYEDMYRQQTQPQAQEEEVKDPKKEAIKKTMQELFQQLDALSHFQYTPRKPASEIRIINNTPALAQEEVAPVGVSDAALVAPEEVQAPLQHDLKAKGERTTTDRKRERRRKKVHQQKKFQAEEKREKTQHPSKAKNKKEREKLLKGLAKKFRGVTVLKS